MGKFKFSWNFILNKVDLKWITRKFVVFFPFSKDKNVRKLPPKCLQINSFIEKLVVSTSPANLVLFLILKKNMSNIKLKGAPFK